ncbi:helix-turn-helix transcriptional regulator [candidate division KSB1 bacterium]|nr:helix-turn-helix transcriptional regulator [candidate division KSB1 bacterium]MBL7092485.1 helix-turn-helix transcriptional regulator [candidate division KSB1 bacterium]
MNPKDKILAYLKKNKTATGKELYTLLGISRQALNKHLKKLISNSLILKNGSTKSTKYTYLPPSRKKVAKTFIYKKELFLKGLEEDRVFNELSLITNLQNSTNLANFKKSFIKASFK